MNTTHQLSLQAVIRYAVLLYRNGFRKLFTIALFAALLSQLLLMPITPEMIDSNTLSISPLTVTMLIASAVIFAISCAALQYLLFAQHRGVSLLPRNAVLLAIKHGFPILGNCLLFGLFTLFGLMLYVIPGIIVATLLFIFLPLTLFENQRSVMALVNSAQWVYPFFFSALAMLLLCLATTSIIPTSIILGVIYLLPPSALPQAVERTLDIFFSALTLPLANCLVFSFYQALKAFHQRPNPQKDA